MRRPAHRGGRVSTMTRALAFPLLALSMVLAAPAWADVSADQAAAAAQRVASGRVLSVEKTEVDPRPVWRVKVLTPQGDVRVTLIDAASGRVVG